MLPKSKTKIAVKGAKLKTHDSLYFKVDSKNGDIKTCQDKRENVKT